MQQKEQFSNRWGIILAALGMAIGAGNLWRFPRLAGQYGGTFIVLWLVFLFVWSIPLLLAEFSIGKEFRAGVIGSFRKLAGGKYTWMGFFITLCALGIAFYYAVVTAWALYYLGLNVGELFAEQPLAERLAADPELTQKQWLAISSGNAVTIGLFVLIVTLGVALLSKGVKNGLEKANKILIPSLFVLLIIIVCIALNMENGFKGLQYMYAIDVSLFKDPVVWIEALSQSAWSTGAGWGLMMTLSSYTRPGEDVTFNTFAGAIGNNLASIIAGMAILPAVFALAGSETEAISFLQSGNQAMTFIVIPKLFAGFSGGAYLSVLFFLALFFAAFSSLLPMIELFIGNLTGFGISRKKVSAIAWAAFIIFGLPSAYSLAYFNNQDWVWGIGLIISGLCVLFGVMKYGIKKFKANLVDKDSDFTVWNEYFRLAIIGNIFLGILLVVWWMSQGYSANPWFTEDGMWNVWDVYSNATIVTQWGLVFLAGFLLNKFLNRKLAETK